MKKIYFLLLLFTSVISARTLVVPTQYSSITAALTAAAGNDTISVLAGVYLESLSISKNVTIIGAPGLTTMIRSGQAGTEGILIDAPIVTVSGATVTLRNLIISAYRWDPLYYNKDYNQVRVGISADNSTLTIDNCKVQQITNFFIQVTNSTLNVFNSGITDEHMLMSSDVGIQATNTQYHISGCTFGYKIDHCISIESGSSGIIENNNITGSAIYWGQGVRLNADGIVRNNTITGQHTSSTTPYFTTAAGVAVSSFWTTMVEIYGNTITGFQNGITLLYGHNSVHDNTIYNNVTNGIYIGRQGYDYAESDLGGGGYNSPGNNSIYNNGTYAINNSAAGLYVFAINTNFNSSDTTAITQKINNPSRVIIGRPPASSLVSPASNSVYNTYPVTVKWNRNVYGRYYDLQISLNSSFNPIAFEDNSVTDTLKQVSTLTSNTQYYWRVRAVNGAGNGLWSPAWNLTTTTGVLPAPVAVSAGSIAQNSFTANWNNVSGAAKYFIDVSTDNSFANFVVGFNNKDAGNVNSISVTGLTAGTVYYYRVRAYDANGTSGNSNIISVTTLTPPPAAPTAAAASSITQTGFTANWNSVSGATGYIINVAADNLFANIIAGYSDKDIGNNTSAAVTGLTPNTIYYYRVKAYNLQGSSTNSNTISASTLPAVASAPTATAATLITSSGFTANWSAVSGATGYYLDLSTDNLFTGFVTGYNSKDAGNVTALAITGLTENTTYYYRIRAYNVSGSSANSNVIQATTLFNTPAAPVALAANSVSQTSFTANWNSVPNSSGYYLDVSTDAAFSAFVTGFNSKDAGNIHSMNIPGLSPNTLYYYRVRAYNNGGTGGNSNVISVSTLPNIPPVPAALDAVSITQTGFTAVWTGSAGASGYYIDVSAENNFNSFVLNNSSTGIANSFPVTGLSPNTTYYYRVRAFNAGGTSGNSNTISVVTIPSAPSAPVATASSSVSQTGFTANWNAASGASGYYIDVSSNSDFNNFLTGCQNKDIGNVTSFVITQLTANSNYYYRLRAYNGGGTSANSNVISVKTLQNILNSPNAKNASFITQAGFNANWDDVNGAEGYFLDAASDSTFNSFLPGFYNRNVNAVATIAITGLNANTNYYYRVRAYTSSLVSSNSKTIRALTLPNTPAAALPLNVSQNSFTAVWTEPGGADGFYLDVSEDNSFQTYLSQYNSRDVGNVLSYTISGLPVNKTFYYRVRAYNSSGISGYSNNSSAVLVLTGTENKTASASTNSYKLYQNYPNPFNPGTIISYYIPEAGEVTIVIYNSAGVEIKTLISRPSGKGYHEFYFNAAGLPSGIYYYKIHVNNFSAAGKMILLK